MSRQSRTRRAATAAAPGRRPAARSRPPRTGCRPAGGARRAGRRAVPPGGPPSGAGWRPWSVPRLRRRWSARRTAAPLRAQQARRPRLETARREPGQGGRLAPVVPALQALPGGPCTVAVTRSAALGDRSRGAHPRPLLRSRGRTPVRPPVAPAAATAAAPQPAMPSPAGPSARAPGPTPGSGDGQPPSPQGASRGFPPAPPEPRGARPGAPRHALPRPHGQGATCQPAGGGERPSTGGRHLGHRPCGTQDARASASTPGAPRSDRRAAPTIGRAAASVWRFPRQREAAASNPRAESEAGARRTHGRWEPTHGDPPDRPSS